MKSVKIKELGEIVTGKTPSTKKPELFGDDYPFITPSDISSYDVYHIQNTERGLSERGYLSQKNKLLPPKTVCYVCIGSTVGKICLTKEPSFTNQQLNSIIVDQSRYVPEYIYYRLRYETPRIQSIAAGTGSGKAIYNKTAFEEHQLEIHDYALQQKIAFVLSAYDDLIENNTRRIQILEEMAQIIYREWFVNFRFPGHEKVRFVNSELGKIPEGWEKSFADFVDFKEGPGLRSYQYKEKGIPFLNIRALVNNDIDFSKVKYLDEKEVDKQYRHFLLEDGDHVVSSSGTLGRIVTIQDFHLPLMLNTSIIRMRSKTKNVGKWQLKHFLKSDYFQNQITSLASGVAQMNYGPSHLKEMFIIAPTQEIGEKYEKIISPLELMISNMIKRNKILRQSRDLLLPKLISGELDVSDLDIIIREQESDTKK